MDQNLINEIKIKIKNRVRDGEVKTVKNVRRVV